MRRAFLGTSIVLISLIFFVDDVAAQSCFNTGLNGSVINLPCNKTCVDVPVRIPHLKGTSAYTVNSVPYNPFPFVNASGTALTSTYIDDKFSPLIDMPFSFCFYDSMYNKVIVGSNGVVTFEEICANQDNAYTLTNTSGAPQPIPYNVGAVPSGIGTTYYPRASIMGAYHDIDPSIIASSPNLRIEYNVFGSAPCRKFVVSYYQIPMFECTSLLCTQQIVLYESTGVVEVYFENKPTCSTWPTGNPGISILGIQNYARNQAVAAPGKNCTAWAETNTGYQFVPSGGASRFVSCSVQQIDGTFIANGDTTTTTPGLLDVTFPTFCPAGSGNQYVVKTVFSACDNPTNQIISYDTITINKTNSMNSIKTVTPTNCGATGSGTASITVQSGIGTGPYTFVLNPGSTTLTGSSPQQFTGLNAGNYSVIVTDAGSCRDSVPFSIVSTGVLSVDYAVTPTTCIGAANGAIQVNPPNGTPPITYSINGGPFTTTSNFPNLPAGTYFISTHDNSGCMADFIPVTIDQGPTITMTTASTLTSCPGASNGSISVTSATGTPPYLYSINGGSYQTDSTFNGLIAGTYFISLADVVGCTISTIPVTVSDGVSTVTGTATAGVTTCAGVNDGNITIAPNGTGPFDYSINGGTIWQTSNIFTSLAPGTYNVIIRVGGACRSDPIPVTITAGNGLQGSASLITPATCPGAHNGSFKVTMTSGSGPYTFVLDATFSQTSAINNTVFNNVASGLHSVTVTDANGCVTTSAITITMTAGTGINADFTPVATGCAGANNGSLIIKPLVPAAAPFTIVLNPGAITQTSSAAQVTFGGLGAGNYSAVVTDANGCQVTIASMTVPAGAGLVGAPTPRNTSCTGINNGTISIQMTSGGAPYTAIMDGTTTQTSATSVILFTAVAPGAHSITVTDANGCVTTSPITTTVAIGAGFTATFTPTPTGCAGATNGKLKIDAQTPQGTAPFTVVLNPGAVMQISATSSITFTNLPAGTYSATITDANGCQFTLNNMSVAAGAGLIGNPSPVGTSCVGINNGTINVTMTSGTAPFTAIMDGTVTQISGTNIISFAGVSPGSHSVTVTDASGCITTSPITTTVATGSGFTAGFSPTPTGCAGASNGKLMISPLSPGVAPFTVVLNPGAVTQTTSSQATFSGLAAGTYTAVVTDANGCQFALNNMTVPTGNALSAVPTGVATSCNGALNGSITITQPNNGTAPYTYSLNAGLGQASQSFNGLAAGSYTVNVTDAGGCSSGSLNVVINAGPSINIRPDKIDVKCFNSLTGSITAVPSANATAPMQYSLDNVTWQASASFNNLAAGTYNVYIKDAVGCFNSADTTITQPLQLQATTNQQAVLCNSASNGKIIVGANGGTTPYYYSLNGAAYQTNNTFNVSAGSSYVIDVKDANGCAITSITNITVSEPAVLTAVPISTNASCDGGSDGKITITPGGGTSPYQYAITGSTYQAANNFNVGPGTYDITVKDANGCSYALTGVVVGLTDNLTYTHMTDPPAICESKTVQLQLVTNATQFSWTNAASLSTSTIANPLAGPSDPTLYKVTATLGRCSIVDSVYVSVMKAPKADAGPPGDICYGKTYQLQGSGGISYSWSPASYLNSYSDYNPVVTPEKTVTYYLTVTDANGCTSLVPGQVTVKVTPPIKVTIYPADTVVAAGVQIPYLATSVGTDYVWSNTTGSLKLNNPNIPNPVATAPLTDGSVVVYKVIATTSAGCQGEAYAKIQVYKGPDLYMVTGFTPNDDGKNDLFIPIPVGIKKLNYFRVIDRWGLTVYMTRELNKGWDGRYKGMEQPSGVFVWMVEGVTMDNKLITKKGTVTLIR